MESSPEPGGLRRRIFLALGLALFVAGAAILGYGLYGYFSEDGATGTGASVSSETPRSNLLPPAPASIKDIEWLPIAIPYNNPFAGESPSDGENPGSSGSPPAVATPLHISIESIDVDAPVVQMGMNSAGVPYVPLNGEDVAWYDFSSQPGQGSNAVFAGHINWGGQRAVFGKLAELQTGDKVRLKGQDGNEFVYEVFTNFPVDPSDPASLNVMQPTEEDIVTLITCGGTWIPDPSEQFGGSYTNRTIVQAKLVQSNVDSAPVPAEISAG